MRCPLSKPHFIMTHKDLSQYTFTYGHNQRLSLRKSPMLNWFQRLWLKYTDKEPAGITIIESLDDFVELITRLNIIEVPTAPRVHTIRLNVDLSEKIVCGLLVCHTSIIVSHLSTYFRLPMFSRCEFYKCDITGFTDPDLNNFVNCSFYTCRSDVDILTARMFLSGNSFSNHLFTNFGNDEQYVFRDTPGSRGVFGPIGSRHDVMAVLKCQMSKGGLPRGERFLVTVGCFRGSEGHFLATLKKTHGRDAVIFAQYKHALNVLKNKT